MSTECHLQKWRPDVVAAAVQMENDVTARVLRWEYMEGADTAEPGTMPKDTGRSWNHRTARVDPYSLDRQRHPRLYGRLEEKA
ncbi:hypothetical protein ADL30_20635 [Streptomyces sp. NRRL S-1521]|nr:hypothetical protein ADL30_20635 [Streptomyces sp. NRRL S-1521]